MQVKVLSVKNPYAYLIIQGGKDVENRTWTTDYRGRLYIHSSGDAMPFPLEEDYPDLKSDKKYDSYVSKIRNFHKSISEYYEKFGITEDTDISSWTKKTDIWFLKCQSII